MCGRRAVSHTRDGNISIRANVTGSESGSGKIEGRSFGDEWELLPPEVAKMTEHRDVQFFAGQSGLLGLRGIADQFCATCESVYSCSNAF